MSEDNRWRIVDRIGRHIAQAGALKETGYALRGRAEHGKIGTKIVADRRNRDELS